MKCSGQEEPSRLTHKQTNKKNFLNTKACNKVQNQTPKSEKYNIYKVQKNSS